MARPERAVTDRPCTDSRGDDDGVETRRWATAVLAGEATTFSRKAAVEAGPRPTAFLSERWKRVTAKGDLEAADEARFEARSRAPDTIRPPNALTASGAAAARPAPAARVEVTLSRTVLKPSRTDRAASTTQSTPAPRRPTTPRPAERSLSGARPAAAA